MVDAVLGFLVLLMFGVILKGLLWDPLWEYPRTIDVDMDPFIDFRSDGREIWIAADFRVRIRGQIHTLPKGAVVNFASVPWFARFLISPIDMTLFIASCLHDWQVDEFGQNNHPLEWEKAAANMRNIMRYYSRGCPWTTRLKRNAVYWAVRIYGVFR